MGLKTIFGRKLRIGRHTAPLWMLGVVGLTGGLMAAAAGQAVGPVLAGNVTGSVGATVGQTVVLNPASAITVDANNTPNGATVSGPVDALGVTNDEGTSFTVAIETLVGAGQVIHLPLLNKSGATANALLELSIPGGIDVEIEARNDAASVKEAQLSQTKWLLQIGSHATDTVGYIDIQVEAKDDLKPGFYTITGKIMQISG